MQSENYVQQSREILRAAELVKLNARTSTVLRLVDVDHRTLRRLSVEISKNDRAGRQGRTPQGVDWYLLALNCVHASAYYNLFIQYSKHCGDLYEAFLQSYQHYTRLQESCGHFRLDIDRALHLIQLVRDRQLRQVKCTGCDGLFVTTYTAIDRLYECPKCSGSLKHKRYVRGTKHPLSASQSASHASAA